MKIAIAGAGIGGLTAALCLNEKGYDARIFEAVETLQPLGVGINVMPHASGVLHGLGLGAPSTRSRSAPARSNTARVSAT